MRCIPRAVWFPPGALAVTRDSRELKELAMTPKFLREEAARFRGMAETVDREASKQRFLMMAVDFEARATAADGAAEPNVGEGVTVKAGKRVAKEPREEI